MERGPAVDDVVAIDCHRHQDEGRQVECQHLGVLDQFAEHVRPHEAVRDVPRQLRQHVEERHKDISHTEVQHEVVHAGHSSFRTDPLQRQQDAAVPQERHQEYGEQDTDLDGGQKLVAAGCDVPGVGAGRAGRAGWSLRVLPGPVGAAAGEHQMLGQPGRRGRPVHHDRQTG